MGIIKNFNDFNKTHESHSVKDPAIKEPKTPEPKLKPAVLREPTVKRSDKKFIKKNINKKKDIVENNKEYTIDEMFSNIEFFNKIAIFKHTIKANDALLFLESTKINKDKLWYFMMDRNENSVQVVKYNPNMGFDLNKFVSELVIYYKKQPALIEHMCDIKVSGNKEFTVIENLTPVIKNLIKIDLVKLLS